MHVKNISLIRLLDVTLKEFLIFKKSLMLSWKKRNFIYSLWPSWFSSCAFVLHWKNPQKVGMVYFSSFIMPTHTHFQLYPHLKNSNRLVSDKRNTALRYLGEDIFKRGVHWDWLPTLLVVPLSVRSQLYCQAWYLINGTNLWSFIKLKYYHRSSNYPNDILFTILV